MADGVGDCTNYDTRCLLGLIEYVDTPDDLEGLVKSTNKQRLK